VEKASQNILAFIHFSMISGGSLKPSSDEVAITDENMPNKLNALR
jgi:hypothetical protein